MSNKTSVHFDGISDSCAWESQKVWAVKERGLSEECLRFLCGQYSLNKLIVQFVSLGMQQSEDIAALQTLLINLSLNTYANLFLFSLIRNPVLCSTNVYVRQIKRDREYDEANKICNIYGGNLYILSDLNYQNAVHCNLFSAQSSSSSKSSHWTGIIGIKRNKRLIEIGLCK